MKIRNTTTGESVNLDGSPFDMAEIIIPKINFIYNITPDLPSGVSLTMQRATNKNTPVIDWSGGYHSNKTNRQDGNGTITVNKDSYSEKLLLYMFNLSDDDKAKLSFNVHYWNQGEKSVQALATNCTLQTVAPVRLDDGSANNNEAEQWTFNAETVKRTAESPNKDILGELDSANASDTEPSTNDEPRINMNQLLDLNPRKSRKNTDNQTEYPEYSSDIDYESYPVPNKDWDVHRIAKWAEQHGYPFNPADLSGGN